jgi:hypothetical protein
MILFALTFFPRSFAIRRPRALLCTVLAVIALCIIFRAHGTSHLDTLAPPAFPARDSGPQQERAGANGPTALGTMLPEQVKVHAKEPEPEAKTEPKTEAAATTTDGLIVPQPLDACPAEHSNKECVCPLSLRESPSEGKHRLAVIVPFRDGCGAGSQGDGRNKNLAEFVPYLHTFLSSQNLDFRIIVVDQVKRGLFNKGFLFNVGYLLANQSYDYLALHDVDLVPENAALKYSFPSGAPMHLCVTNSRTAYQPAYEGMVGGVLLMRAEQYAAVNGFANTYWTWGQEDDDMYNRLRGIHGAVMRPAPDVGRYRALDHVRVEGLDETPRFRTQRGELQAAIAAANQGKEATTAHVMKNGLRQVQYRIVDRGCRADYEHYRVDYLNPDQPMGPC